MVNTGGIASQFLRRQIDLKRFKERNKFISKLRKKKARAEARMLQQQLKIKKRLLKARKRQAKIQAIKQVKKKFKTSSAGRISTEIKRLLFKKKIRRRRRR